MVSYIQCGGGGNGSSGLVGDLGFYCVVLANVLDSGQYRLPRPLDFVNSDLAVVQNLYHSEQTGPAVADFG